MSSRYITRKYGAELSPTRLSRPASRAASRAPSMAPCSRDPSPVHSYYNGSSPAGSRGSTPMSYNSEYISRRSPSPLRTGYTDVLCAASRRLRERSIPPPPPPLQRIEPVRPPVPPGKPPPGPRVVASDFYKGRVKSIYEREPLFNDFCRTIPQRYGPKLNIYNSGVLDTIKHDFKDMVEDKMTRKSLKDPAVERDFGTKAYPWRDTLAKEREPASARIYRTQEARRGRASTPVNMPRVYVYHRSTMSPAPNY